MKTVKLVCMAMMSMAMIMVSCSGEDGEQGIPGKDGMDGINGVDGADGADGADGISCWDLNGNGTGDAEEDINQDGNFDALDCQGEDGADGVDGNANVTEHTFNLDIFGDYSVLNLDLNNIVDEPANYAYLYYLVVLDDSNPIRISIPGSLGALTGEDVDVEVYTVPSTGDLSIHFLQNGSPFEIPGSPFPELIVVAIELSNTGKTSENVMSELKTAGVDTSDYNAVAAYFGLE